MSNVQVITKNEKKAREMIAKLGLKKVAGIARVTFRKKNNQIIAIDNPEVYKSQGGNYVVFGEAKVDDFTQKLAAAQSQVESTGILPAVGGPDKSPESITNDMQAAAANGGAKVDTEEVSDDIDAGDLSKEDIGLVMEQAGVARGKAVKALKDHNGDIVNAIMSLSK